MRGVVTAAETMTQALLDLTDHEQRPPCGDRSGAWTSEDRRERQSAAKHCAGCPLLDPCGQYGDEIRTRFGAWGGHDRTPRPMKARTK